MARKADSHFELGSSNPKPSIVFEYGPLMEFNTAVANSKHRQEIENALKTGDLQVVNHDFIEQLSLTHSRFLSAIHDMGVRVPPTIIRFTNPSQPPLIAGIGTPLPKESALWVKKVSFDESGKQFGHGGKGISFIAPKNALQIIPSHDHEFYQQFVIPQDGIIRDVRVFVVGDKIIPGYIRKATKPITRENLNGLMPIQEDQFVTAKHPGIIEPLTGELAQKTTAEATKVRQALIDRVKRRRTDWAKQDLFGFGSIDFLLDANGEPMVSEFDTGPQIRDVQGLKSKLAKEMAGYLARKAGNTHTVRIYGEEEEQFIEHILKNLRTLLPANRIIYKPPLHSVA
jgi:hypothetical protein